MKKLLKIYLLIITFISCFVLADHVHANNFSASLSKSTVSPNESVTVTLSGLTNIRGRFDVSVGNGSGSTSFSVTGQPSSSFAVRAGSSGTTTIDIVLTDGATIDGVDISGQRTRLLVNIVSSNSSGSTGSGNGGSTGGGSNGWSSNNGANYPSINNGSASSNHNGSSSRENDVLSSDNVLSSLSVSQGTLTPSFSGDVMDYRLDLPSTATSLKIDAVAVNEKATILGMGEYTLQVGENIIEVACRAENGDLRTYTIVVNVDETPLVYTDYNGDRLGVVTNLSSVVVPEGFEETTVTLEGQEVKAWRNGISNITILYLSKENGEKNFYLYDEQKGVTSIYKPIFLAGGNYAIIDIPQELQQKIGMIYKEIQIDDYTMNAWKYEDSALDNFALLYLMNSKGETHLYQYESTMNTLQLYNGNVAISQKGYDEMLKNHERSTRIQWIFIGGLVLTNSIALISLFMVMKNQKRKTRKFMEVEEEKPEIDEVAYLDENVEDSVEEDIAYYSNEDMDSSINQDMILNDEE